MTTTRGHLNSVTRAFSRIGKTGDIVELNAYTSSAEFAGRFAALPPSLRGTVMRSYVEAWKRCEARKPVAKPGTRVRRWDDLMIARFNACFAKHRGNLYRVACEMKLTEGAAERAWYRFIVADATTYAAEKPPRMTQDGRWASRPSLPPGPKEASAGVSGAAL
jgi:hypothetical protein